MTTGQQLTHYDAAYAARAAAQQEAFRPEGGKFLSIRGGILKYGEEEMPGNQACVVILDAVRENLYYPQKFDQDNPMPPTCYAFARGADVMAPHVSMADHLEYFEPQANDCKSCQWNAWGSADQGRGKACKNAARLALLPAGVYQPRRGSRDFDLKLFTDQNYFRAVDMVFIKLPVTSVKNFSKYVSACGALNVPRSTDGVVTRLHIEPDEKSQYMVHFEMLEVVSDVLVPGIMARADEAAKNIVFGYSPPEEREAPQPGALRNMHAAGAARNMRRAR